MKIKNQTATNSLFVIASIICGFVLNAPAQESVPAPGPPRSVNIPAVKEFKLKNGLTVAVVERPNIPLVSVRLMINSGSVLDDIENAGLAQMTASLLTKGTITRTATQIANQVEFLGGSISSNTGLDDSSLSISVTSDKLVPAMTVFSDVALKPSFPLAEIDLAKSQASDELTYNLTQPGFLANYVASVYSLYGTPADGTPQSIKSLNRKMITDFYRENYVPESATLLFIGDIDSQTAFSLATRYFGSWRNPPKVDEGAGMSFTESTGSMSSRKRTEAEKPLVQRILVIDLPKSGQAAVAYVKHLQFAGRIVWDDDKKRGDYSENYFPALVMNSILGGGYSSRLNQEIRIKRGLSYGAASSIRWRAYDSHFSVGTQTKNESASEVAELVTIELKKLMLDDILLNELASRKAVLTGNYGRNIETNSGLVALVSDLYSDWQPATELNNYTNKVNSVSIKQIKDFASSNLLGGDIIIVGDYAKFKDDLAKRFQNITIDVIKADEIDLSKDNLRKGN